LLGVALLAVWPFLTRPGLPTLTDAQHHVYRTFQLLEVWRAGVFYPRWAPDLYLGFGYPVFNFYAPLAYYLSAAYGLYFGPVAGVKFAFVFSALAGALGMYLLARERFAPLPALVAAGAFVLAPYLAYLNPHARGALPETLAVALMPWLLAALSRLYRRRTLLALAGAALAMALLLLSHNLLAWVTAALSLAWVVWEAVTIPVTRRAWWRGLPWSAAAFALGPALAAFFWLPAFGELSYVQFMNAFLPTDEFQWVPAAQLFGLARLADQSSPDLRYFVFRLGLPQWLLATLGLVAVADSRLRPLWPTLIFFGMAGGALVWLVLPFAADAWVNLPGIAYLQFPWRLLGPAALALAMLAAGAVQWAIVRLPAFHAATLGLLALAAVTFAALPLLDPLPWPDPGPVTFREMFALERSGAWGVGTTHAGEFLPNTVVAIPAAMESLIASYDVTVRDKVDHASLPPGVEVTPLAHGPLHDAFSVAAPAEFTLRLLTFHFPGWTAWVDGSPVPMTPSDPHGWITLPVPAGDHHVTVRLLDTPLRRLAWAISALASLAWVFILAAGLRRPAQPRSTANGLPRPVVFSALLLTASVLALRFVADRFSPWVTADADPPRAAGAQHVLDARLADKIALLGYDLPLTRAAPGEQVALTLYWQAAGRVGANLSVFVHLYGPDRQVYGQSDKYVPLPFFPTGRWPVGRVMLDPHQLSVDPGAPPGPYTLAAGMWDRVTGRRSAVLEAAGWPGDAIVLTTEFQVQP
jgi:hypothetical protein